MGKKKGATLDLTPNPITRKVLVAEWIKEAKKPEGKRGTRQDLSNRLAERFGLEEPKAYARINAICVQLKKKGIELPPIGKASRGPGASSEMAKELDDIRSLLTGAGFGSDTEEAEEAEE